MGQSDSYFPPSRMAAATFRLCIIWKQTQEVADQLGKTRIFRLAKPSSERHLWSSVMQCSSKGNRLHECQRLEAITACQTCPAEWKASPPSGMNKGMLRKIKERSIMEAVKDDVRKQIGSVRASVGHQTQSKAAVYTIRKIHEQLISFCMQGRLTKSATYLPTPTPTLWFHSLKNI